jgi:hypothetical protein
MNSFWRLKPAGSDSNEITLKLFPHQSFLFHIKAKKSALAHAKTV